MIQTGALIISEFYMKVRGFSDNLASIGHVVSDCKRFLSMLKCKIEFSGRDIDNQAWFNFYCWSSILSTMPQNVSRTAKHTPWCESNLFMPLKMLRRMENKLIQIISIMVGLVVKFVIWRSRKQACLSNLHQILVGWVLPWPAVSANTASLTAQSTTLIIA